MNYLKKFMKVCLIKLDKTNTLRTEGRARRQPVGRVLGRTSVYRLIPMTIAAALLINLTPLKANAYPLKRHHQDWALVAMNHLGDLYETQCWVDLIWRESRFNPQARNGSHYGLAQMRNEKVKSLSPRQQVRWHLRYLEHRYSGSACLALDHLKIKGWH